LFVMQKQAASEDDSLLGLSKAGTLPEHLSPSVVSKYIVNHFCFVAKNYLHYKGSFAHFAIPLIGREGNLV